MPRKYRKGKKKYNVSINKLKSKKIDSLIERRMRQIAKKEAEKVRVRLLHRTFMGDVDEDEHDFSNGKAISYDGTAYCISQIPKQDIKVGVPETTADIVQTAFNEANVQGIFGGVQAATDKMPHGYRQEDRVLVTSMSLQIRARIPESSTSTTKLKNCTIYYAFVRYRGDLTIAPSYTPGNNQLLPWPRPFGYDKRVDPEILRADKELNLKILKHGKITLNQNDSRPDVKERRMHFKYKKPQELLYEEDDFNGDNPINDKYFLVVRSDVPSHQDYVKPEVWTCVKFNYYNV